MSPRGTGVVICVRDGARYIEEAIASAGEQSRRPDEILVVDDGSRDHSAALARRAGARVISQPPLGLGAARNRAFAEARCAIVVAVDADDRLTPNAIERLTAALEEAPHALGARGLMRQFLSPEVDAPPAVVQAIPTAAQPCVLLGGAAWHRDRVVALPFAEGAHSVDVHWIADIRARGEVVAALEELVLLRRVHRRNTSLAGESRRGYLQTARESILRHRAGSP